MGRERSRHQRREYKRRVRRAAGAEPMEVKRARAAQRGAEQEAKRIQRLLENDPDRKPWLRFPGGAIRYRWRYQNDPEFAQRERERAIVFRYTHPEIAAKSDHGNHWSLAASRADGSVTEAVVRDLLRARACYLCGIELTAANRSIDHRVALTLGGNHSAGNLAACCLPCNREKAHHERRQAREARRQCVPPVARERAVKEGKHAMLEAIHAPDRLEKDTPTTYDRVPATPGFQNVGDL